MFLGFPYVVDRRIQQYWYSKGLQSAYVCFRYFKLSKVIQVNRDYFYGLLSCTLECLRSIQQKEVLHVRSPVIFIDECLAGYRNVGGHVFFWKVVLNDTDCIAKETIVYIPYSGKFSRVLIFAVFLTSNFLNDPYLYHVPVSSTASMQGRSSKIKKCKKNFKIPHPRKLLPSKISRYTVIAIHSC